MKSSSVGSQRCIHWKMNSMASRCRISSWNFRRKLFVVQWTADQLLFLAHTRILFDFQILFHLILIYKISKSKSSLFHRWSAQFSRKWRLTIARFLVRIASDFIASASAEVSTRLPQKSLKVTHCAVTLAKPESRRAFPEKKFWIIDPAPRKRQALGTDRRWSRAQLRLPVWALRHCQIANSKQIIIFRKL